MSVWSWLLNHWREGDELMRRRASHLATIVERIRQWRHGEPDRTLIRSESTPFPTATGPPSRRRRRRAVMIAEDVFEEDHPGSSS